MNSAAQQTSGFTLIEVLVALGILVVFVAALSSSLLGSLKADQTSRQTTSLSGAVESWQERYRLRQEPIGTASAGCTVNATSFTCTYASTWNYATDGVSLHAGSAAAMQERFGPFNNTITGTLLAQGINRQLWKVQVQVQDPVSKQVIKAVTYVN